jgi:Fe-S cluster assembly ATP-binding protein
MKLEIKNLHVKVGNREVIKGIDLTIKEGEFHVLMGPNGSGKTTLSKAILGHPKMRITSGDILVDGKSIVNLSTDKRARLGIFMQFQQPVEIEGLGLISFLNAARSSLQDRSPLVEFMKDIKQTADSLHIRDDIIGSSLNYGLSGGEKKKLEILQMQLLRPKIAILDEPDSGLDVDAVKAVASSVNEFRKKSNAGILLITHYSRILNYMKPDHVHVMIDGMIVKNGGKELAERIEKEGYKT